jgi:hypothetical protein
MPSESDRERPQAPRHAGGDEELQAVVDRYESVLAQRERLRRAEKDARRRGEEFVWSGADPPTASGKARTACTDGGRRRGLLARLRDLF